MCQAIVPRISALLWMSLFFLISFDVHAERYWLDSRFDQSQTHYRTGEEACVTGELQRRTDVYRASSTLPHRYASAYFNEEIDDYGTCRGQIQKRQFNMWLPVEVVDSQVYVVGDMPPCALPGLADPDTGQCGVPKCDDGCPVAGGNGSNPIDSATGNKRQVATDYQGSGVFPLRFERYYNSHRTIDNESLPLGVGWTHNYLSRVVLVPASSGLTRARVYRPNGAIQEFNYDGSVWKPDADVPEQLNIVIVDGALASATYARNDDTIENYDSFGRLTTITSRDGLSQTLTYSSGAGFSPYVQKVVDPQGKSLTFSYVNGQLTSMMDSAGRTIAYGYSNGDLVSVSYPNATAGNDVLTYHYNESGQTGGVSQPHLLTGITDQNSSRYASWGYDANRRGTLSVHGAYASATADRVALQYNTNGSSTITDSLGKSRTFNFGVDHRVARLTSLDALCLNCSNVASARTYDANGYPASKTDFAGNVTQNTFNTRGLETQRIEAATDSTGRKRTVQIDWQASFRVPAERRAYNAAGVLVSQATWTYNTRGQALTATQIDPTTSTTRTRTTSYCEQADITAGTCPLLGLVKSVDGPRTDVADTIAYTYYPSDDTTCASAPITCPHRKGDLWKVTNALGQATEILNYDGVGRVLSAKDANDVITDMEYHPRGWLTARKTRGTNNAVETDDLITRIEYWPTGLVKRVTQPDGAFTAYTYDTAHRLTDIADNAGNKIHYALDNAGNRIQEDTEDPANVLKRTLSRVYNQLSQLQIQADAQANPTDFTYDANGNTDTMTDALGRVSDNDYDPLNRLNRTLQNVGGINAETRFQYDALDNLTQVTDPKGLNTSYTYNGFGDLTRLVSPDTGTTNYTYDSAGNRASQTDARGVTVGYRYDALNRLVGIDYPDTSRSLDYYYDFLVVSCPVGEQYPQGRLGKVKDISGTIVRYCYDRFGNVTRKFSTSNGKIFTQIYTYTKSGQLSSVTYSDGAKVDYVRDAQGRITEIGATPVGRSREVLLNQVTYYPFGPVSGWTYGNGRSLQRIYNQNYQPVGINVSIAGGLSLGFDFDAVGNLTKLTPFGNGSPLVSFDYDGLDRLTHFRDGPTGTAIETYTYDATGNRTSQTDSAGTKPYLYPSTSHRLSSAGGVPRSYDGAGNTTTIGGASREFIYNDANRLSQVKVGGVVTMNYDYNGLGQQVRRYPNATSTAQVYTLYDEDGRWSGDYYSAGVAIQQAIWLDDLPVGLFALGGGGNQRAFYVEPDHLGTPRAVVNPVNNVVIWTWDAKGEAFGDSAPNEDPDGNGLLFVLNMRFPGQRYDAASGLNYNYFRDYDPETGRYPQSDPIGLAGGITTYGYANNNPLGIIDRYGLNWSKAQCDAFRAEIMRKFGLLVKELTKYDPVADGRGGHPMRGGITKPGGHYIEIGNLQRGLKNDLGLYTANCRKDNDDGNPPVNRNVDEACNREIPEPVIPGDEKSITDWEYWEEVTGLSGAALVLYLIVSEGSRVFPPRNLVPVP